jgi:hypothetical protein
VAHFTGKQTIIRTGHDLPVVNAGTEGVLQSTDFVPLLHHAASCQGKE